MQNDLIDFTWKIGGEAGMGIMISGGSFAKICSRAGLHVISNTEYPSLIRGGHNNFTVRGSNKKIYALNSKITLLLALNKETITLHRDTIQENGFLLHEPKDVDNSSDKFDKNIKLIPVPFTQLARENHGDILMRNTVALGASAAILGLGFELITEVLTDQFNKKGSEVVNLNIQMAKVGFDFINTNFKEINPAKITGSSNKDKVILTANEAIASAAISAGMKFFSAYPMTPINGLINFMASHDRKFNVIYKQPEDEISGINMAIGASFAGVRSMTATSGGGFALMNEAFSMAGMTETPLVVVYGQRPGPASGLPTWTSQGDLRYALSAGHGEFLRFVFAPGDVEEAYWLTKLAFNLSDKYQTPAIILVDKLLCEAVYSLEKKNLEKTTTIPETVMNFAKTINRGKVQQNPDNSYQRYQYSEDGVSPRLFPGKGAPFTVNSYEHNEKGLSTEIASEIKAMIDKRNKKTVLAQSEAFGPLLYGPQKADITLVGWGSTKMAVLEAINELTNSDLKEKVNYLHFNFLSPFPTNNTIKLLAKVKKIVDVEGNSQGQLADLIREKTGILIEDKILKYDGRQFFPEEIISGLKVIINK